MSNSKKQPYSEFIEVKARGNGGTSIQGTVEHLIVFLSDIMNKLFSCIQAIEGVGNPEKKFTDRTLDLYSTFKDPNKSMPDHKMEGMIDDERNKFPQNVTAGQEVCQNRRFKSIPQGVERAPLDYRSYFLRQLFVEDLFV
ncbi:MAG: hypothetical protein HQK59_09030, partial [Deltaproteobacteria bacterium]|nr:hypothetical protein [Deltaproteobacteria bacterium]